MEARLVLEDGTVFRGIGLGRQGLAVGEVVFATSMMGYQELLTDPSYAGQILTLTVPHVGNVGCNPEDWESNKAWLSGFVVRDLPRLHSNWRATSDLNSWLREQGVAAIGGLDTRALVRHIRSQGAMRGVVSSSELDEKKLLELAREAPPMEGRDLVHEVTCSEPEHWPSEKPRFRVVAYDFGIKRHMLELLQERGLEIWRVPADTSAEEVLARKPDGVFLSNGPGDPAALDGIVGEVKKLLGKVPLFGICLGHQLLGRALGASTFKLKFGHRGANQPVRNEQTGKVEITAQNHGFAVDGAGLDERTKVTHLNLNDGTVEGLEVLGLKAFSVQYHPESSPGPHDSRYLFDHFLQLMEGELN